MIPFGITLPSGNTLFTPCTHTKLPAQYAFSNPARGNPKGRESLHTMLVMNRFLTESNGYATLSIDQSCNSLAEIHDTYSLTKIIDWTWTTFRRDWRTLILAKWDQKAIKCDPMLLGELLSKNTFGFIRISCPAYYLINGKIAIVSVNTEMHSQVGLRVEVY